MAPRRSDGTEELMPSRSPHGEPDGLPGVEGTEGW